MPGPPLCGSCSAMGKLRAAHLRPLQGGVIFICRLTIFSPALPPHTFRPLLPHPAYWHGRRPLSTNCRSLNPGYKTCTRTEPGGSGRGGLLHGGLPCGGQTQIQPPVGQRDAAPVAAPGNDHDLRCTLAANFAHGLDPVPSSSSMASRWTSSTTLIEGYRARYSCTPARLRLQLSV